MQYYETKEDMEKAGVYIIVGLENNVFYVGSTHISFKERFRCHRKSLNAGKHHSVFLQNTTNKYGSTSLLFVILEIVDDTNLVLNTEQRYIDMWFRLKGCANTLPTAGSTLGHKVKDTSRIKEANRKTMSNPATIEKKRKHMQQRYSKPEEREKQSKRLSEYLKDPEARKKRGIANTKLWSDVVFISPSGDEYKNVYNLRQFCKDHSIHVSTMYETVQGKHTHCKGWRVKKNDNN